MEWQVETSPQPPSARDGELEQIMTAWGRRGKVSGIRALQSAGGGTGHPYSAFCRNLAEEELSYKLSGV